MRQTATTRESAHPPRAVVAVAARTATPRCFGRNNQGTLLSLDAVQNYAATVIGRRI
jgi:hypothetical protein